VGSGAGFRWRNQDWYGVAVEMQGSPASSQTSATGLVVSGVEAASIRATWSRSIRSLATSAARSGLDWLSRCRISTR
jgi:hypothetical protein